MITLDPSRLTKDQPRIALTLPRELSLTARLGTPLAIGELGWMSTYIVDALMIGRLPHSALSISASSLGNTIFYVLAFCAIGMLTGIETLVAQSYGRGDAADGTRTLAQSLWFVLIGTPTVMLATLACIPLLHRFGTPPDIIAETSRYIHALIWSTAPLLLYMALRRYLQSIDRVFLVMVSLLSASLVNLLGDWAFLYGHLGFHPMGIAGSAWATCIVRVYMLAILAVGLVLAIGKSGQRLSVAMLKPDLPRLAALTRIGWPPALQSFTDYGVSTFMSILCARLGATMLAAHQVVLDLDAFVYMVPMGLAWATVVRVGQSAGRNSLPQVRRSANASLILGLGFIAIAGSLFAGLPRLWAGMYTNDPAVVTAAAPVFLICGFIQLGDAASVLLASALTALGDTRSPMIVYTAWYWGVGMPLSYWLTFHAGLSLRGLWAGRCLAALGSAATLALVWRIRLRQFANSSQASSVALLTPMHAK